MTDIRTKRMAASLRTESGQSSPADVTDDRRNLKTVDDALLHCSVMPGHRPGGQLVGGIQARKMCLHCKCN